MPKINPEWEKLGPQADIHFSMPVGCVNFGPAPSSLIPSNEVKRLRKELRIAKERVVELEDFVLRLLACLRKSNLKPNGKR